MFNQLTQKDIDAMEAEIEERKLVIRPKLLEAVKEAKILNTMRLKKKKIKMKAGSVF